MAGRNTNGDTIMRNENPIITIRAVSLKTPDETKTPIAVPNNPMVIIVLYEIDLT